MQVRVEEQRPLRLLRLRQQRCQDGAAADRQQQVGVAQWRCLQLWRNCYLPAFLGIGLHGRLTYAGVVSIRRGCPLCLPWWEGGKEGSQGCWQPRPRTQLLGKGIERGA